MILARAARNPRLTISSSLDGESRVAPKERAKTVMGKVAILEETIAKEPAPIAAYVRSSQTCRNKY
jgi:type II secretory pathway component PulC